MKDTAMRKPPSAAELGLIIETIAYDPKTGVLTRKRKSRRIQTGSVAGWINSQGYRMVHIMGRDYRGHHIAWFLMTGSWPEEEIDHKDGKTANNKWKNLRPASHAQNSRNTKRHKDNKSGYKGVVHYPKRGFSAFICVSGKRKYLGTYSTPQEAHAAYLSAATASFGEYAREG